MCRALSRVILHGLDLGAVIEAGVPVAAALRREVHEVPDGSEEVDAPLLDVWGHPRMRTIEMVHGAVGVAGENGNGGVLMPFAVLAAQIVLESAVAGAEQAQLVSATRAGVRAHRGDIRGRDHGEVQILSEMMGHAIGAVEPGVHIGQALVCRFPYIR